MGNLFIGRDKTDMYYMNTKLQITCFINKRLMTSIKIIINVCINLKFQNQTFQISYKTFLELYVCFVIDKL